MLIDAPRPVVDAILGAMENIALVHGEEGVTPADRRTIAAAGRIVFGYDEEAAMVALPVRTPQELAKVLTDDEHAKVACRVLSIMTAVDMKLDAPKVDLVNEYAKDLGVHEDYLDVLAHSLRDEMAQAAACMLRNNLLSFPNLDHTVADYIEAFLPYKDGKDDPSCRRGTRPWASCRTTRSAGLSGTTSSATRSRFRAIPTAWARASPRRTIPRTSSPATPPLRPARSACPPSSAPCTPTIRWPPRSSPCSSAGTWTSRSPRLPAAFAVPTSPTASGPPGTAAAPLPWICSIRTGTSGPPPGSA